MEAQASLLQLTLTSDPYGPWRVGRYMYLLVEVKISNTTSRTEVDAQWATCLKGANGSSGGAGPVAPSRNQPPLHMYDSRQLKQLILPLTLKLHLKKIDIDIAIGIALEQQLLLVLPLILVWIKIGIAIAIDIEFQNNCYWYCHCCWFGKKLVLTLPLPIWFMEIDIDIAIDKGSKNNWYWNWYWFHINGIEFQPYGWGCS